MRTLFSILVLLPLVASSQEMNNHLLVDKMLGSISRIKTLECDLSSRERKLDDNIAKMGSSVKLQIKPSLKIYSYVRGKDEGTELLYVAGKNNNKVLVNPNRFPYINVNLSPFGSSLRSGQHHSIFELGYSYFYEVIKDCKTKAGSNFDGHFKYLGEAQKNGYDCYKLLIVSPDYKLVDYTVQKGENLHDIGYKLKANDYTILHANADVDDYDDVKTGQVIKVPNYYAPKVFIYVHKKLFVPVEIVIHDEKGFYELYSYSNIRVNRNIPDIEFSEDFKDYGF